MNIVRKVAKIIVTKANSLNVLPHLECVLLRRLHFCCFRWTRRSFLKKFGWDHPKTRFDFVKCPEQKDKSLRTAVTSNHDRNRLWDVRQGCQPPPFGGPWACPRWSAGSGPTSSVFFKSLVRVTHKMFMLITYITCFTIYLATQQCINFYFWGNISSFMTENNSSRFSGHPVPTWPASDLRAFEIRGQNKLWDFTTFAHFIEVCCYFGSYLGLKEHEEKLVGIQVFGQTWSECHKVSRRRGSWGSPDPLRFSDSGACLTCLSGKVTDVVDTLNNFEQNPS